MKRCSGYILCLLLAGSLSAQPPAPDVVGPELLPQVKAARLRLAVEDLAQFRRQLLTSTAGAEIVTWRGKEDGFEIRLRFASEAAFRDFSGRLEGRLLAEEIHSAGSGPRELELTVERSLLVWPDFMGALTGLAQFLLRLAYVLVWLLPLWLCLGLLYWKRGMIRGELRTGLQGLGRLLRGH